MGSTQRPQGSTTKKRKPHIKTESPLTPRIDRNGDTARNALRWAEWPVALLSRRAGKYSEVDHRDFIIPRFAFRFKNHGNLLRYNRLFIDFLEFSANRNPTAPAWGDAALLVIADWPDAIRRRGGTAPRNGRYAPRLFGEPLVVYFPIGHTSFCSSERIRKRRKIRQAPLRPLGFVLKLDLYAPSRDDPKNERFPPVCRASFDFQFATFRGGSRNARYLAYDDRCARRWVDQKTPGGERINWAAPRRFARPNRAWVNPAISYRAKVKPDAGGISPPRPILFEEMGSLSYQFRRYRGYRRGAYAGEIMLGFAHLATLRIARNWSSTYAKQLLASKEGRTALGRWGPGSDTPDRYGRSADSTELT